MLTGSGPPGRPLQVEAGATLVGRCLSTCRVRESFGAASPLGTALASGPSWAVRGCPPTTHDVGHDGFRVAPWIGCRHINAAPPVRVAGRCLPEHTCFADGYRACRRAGFPSMGIPTGARSGRPMDDRPGGITDLVGCCGKPVRSVGGPAGAHWLRASGCMLPTVPRHDGFRAARWISCLHIYNQRVSLRALLRFVGLAGPPGPGLPNRRRVDLFVSIRVSKILLHLGRGYPRRYGAKLFDIRPKPSMPEVSCRWWSWVSPPLTQVTGHRRFRSTLFV